MAQHAEPLALEGLKGKVVFMHAFQMLCPGCVTHGLPQAQRVFEKFKYDKVTVVGLHTVFEHHSAMTATALKAFAYEYRFNFPIGIDHQGAQTLPETMTAYQMRGTPTIVLIDRQGNQRLQVLG